MGIFYFPKIKDLFLDISMIVSMLSLSVVFCLFSLPHISQRCVMINLSPLDSTATGAIIPPQVAARSPGLLSTCRDHRQFGQWFVYPLPETTAPQWAQLKSSTVFVKPFIISPTHYDTSVLIHRLRLIHLGQVYANESSGEYILGQNLRT